jgi:predicted membrane-bound spermidine synthase
MAHQDDAVVGVVNNSAGRAFPRARVVFWLGTATLTGAVIMGLELVSFRLYAPYLGYSIYVWGSMISVVMAALSAGYALGGWMADRSESDLPLYATVLASGLYQLIVVFGALALLRRLEGWGEFTGTVIATLLIFAPPMTALAITSPFVIRLLARAGRVGVTAGRVYALSTVGSIAGVLATTFLLIPRFGTRMTLIVLSTASVVLGAAGLAAFKRIALVGLLPLTIFALVPAPGLPVYEIWRAESAYNSVRVIRWGGYLWLALNQLRYSHTTRKERALWAGSYQDDYALGPLLVRGRRLLVLGMGAGASIIVTRAVAEDIQVDAVEIDPKVVEAAGLFFGIRPDPQWLRIHVADARPWLAQDSRTYDLVHVDLYHGGPYIPFYLATEEFFRLVRARLAEDGLLMMNVYDRGKKRELLSATVATLQRVFATVAVLSRDDGNHILFASPQKRTVDSLRAALAGAGSDEKVGELARRAASRIAEIRSPEGAPVFTDDHAPIEELIRKTLVAPQH